MIYYSLKFSDDFLKVVSEDELKEMTKTCLEYDGFLGFYVVKKLTEEELKVLDMVFNLVFEK